jgi:hypothetical protein
MHQDHLLVNEPATRQATLWHQDQPHHNVSSRQNRSLWIPADPVQLASTLRFVGLVPTPAPGMCRARSATTRPGGSPKAG